MSAQHNFVLERVRKLARERMRRWRERMNPAALRAQKRAIQRVENFWKKVNKTESCWIWTGAKNKKGYGSFGVQANKTMSAHRFAWRWAYGEVPDNMQILHRCDNPSCVNPNHLFLGTNLDNVLDRENKGRGNQPRGSANGNARLNETIVIQILKLGDVLTQVEIARRFHTTQGTVGKILRREVWRHVDI
jgi:hypothetical protein